MENLQVMLVLARFTGFNSYLYQETQDGFVATLSRPGFCLFIVNLVAYVYFSIDNVLNMEMYSYTGSKIVDTGGKIIIEFAFLNFIIISIDRFYRHHWTTMLLNRLRSIDKELDAMHARTPRSYRYSEQLFQMIVLECCIIGAIVYSVYIVEQKTVNCNVSMYIGHQMIGVSLGIVTSTFYAEVYELRLRLKDINLHIRNTMCDVDFHLQPTTRKISVTNKNDLNVRKMLIARIALIYDDLHNVSIKISNHYKFVFAGFCIVNIMYGIMTLYIFYRSIFEDEYANRIAISIFLAWGFIYKFSLFQTMICCHLLHAESKTTASLISITLSQETEKQCIKKLYSFLCQIQHNSIKITTYVFDINMSAFFGVFGTIVTYLFILLQFTG